MALLNEGVYREKLEKLNTSQQSIEQTSAWCIFHRGDARRVAEVWEEAFSKADQPKRLAMVYLANDIIQTGCAHKPNAAAAGRPPLSDFRLPPPPPLTAACLPVDT